MLIFNSSLLLKAISCKCLYPLLPFGSVPSPVKGLNSINKQVITDSCLLLEDLVLHFSELIKISISPSLLRAFKWWKTQLCH